MPSKIKNLRRNKEIQYTSSLDLKIGSIKKIKKPKINNLKFNNHQEILDINFDLDIQEATIKSKDISNNIIDSERLKIIANDNELNQKKEVETQSYSTYLQEFKDLLKADIDDDTRRALEESINNNNFYESELDYEYESEEELTDDIIA